MLVLDTAACMFTLSKQDLLLCMHLAWDCCAQWCHATCKRHAGQHVTRAKQYALARLKSINSTRQLTSLSTTRLQSLR